MSSHLSVLIVDDDPTCLQLLQAILEDDRGFASPRRTGRRRRSASVKARSPDILVTDLRMPEMSGLDLVRAVRALDEEIYCLIVTGFASDEVTAEVYRAGVRDLLLKPINVAEVQARVQNAAELVSSASRGARAPCRPNGSP